MKKGLLFLIIPVVMILMGVGAYVVVDATPSSTINLSDYFEVSFEGYNTMGKVDITRKDELMFDDMDSIRVEQRDSFFRNKDVKEEDYMIFAAGIEAICDAPEEVSNGETYKLSYLYNEELAKELKITVDSEPTEFTVEGLSDATALSIDDLFADISVTFEGISPNITMTLTNNSANPFIQSLVFNPVEYKETYAAGDTVRIRCYFNDNEMLSDQYYIDALSEECVRDYLVSGTDEYVSSIDQIPAEVIKEAFAAGKRAFVDANEYGVRIFCEANLVPVYIDKKATFRYLEPSLISAYFKTVYPSAAGKDGNHYNDLDLIYKVNITQADGVTCGCEAVVRFSDFILRKDGTIEYDFSNPSIMSASYKNSAIVKNVVTRYEGTHEVNKLDLSKY